MIIFIKKETAKPQLLPLGFVNVALYPGYDCEKTSLNKWIVSSNQLPTYETEKERDTYTFVYKKAEDLTL